MMEMMDFSVALLGAVCQFLLAPPVFYLFGLVCFCYVCKALKILMSR